jgi:hypothetical protein
MAKKYLTLVVLVLFFSIGAIAQRTDDSSGDQSQPQAQDGTLCFPACGGDGDINSAVNDMMANVGILGIYAPGSTWPSTMSAGGDDGSSAGTSSSGNTGGSWGGDYIAGNGFVAATTSRWTEGGWTGGVGYITTGNTTPTSAKIWATYGAVAAMAGPEFGDKAAFERAYQSLKNMGGKTAEDLGQTWYDLPNVKFRDLWGSHFWKDLVEGGFSSHEFASNAREAIIKYVAEEDSIERIILKDRTLTDFYMSGRTFRLSPNVHPFIEDLLKMMRTGEGGNYFGKFPPLD